MDRPKLLDAASLAHARFGELSKMVDAIDEAGADNIQYLLLVRELEQSAYRAIADAVTASHRVEALLKERLGQLRPDQEAVTEPDAPNATPPQCGIRAGEPEILGERCADGATCHHNCGQACFRKGSCLPLTLSGLNNDWSIPVAAA
jgi:hypothetical protein